MVTATLRSGGPNRFVGIKFMLTCGPRGRHSLGTFFGLEKLQVSVEDVELSDDDAQTLGPDVVATLARTGLLRMYRKYLGVMVSVKHQE